MHLKKILLYPGVCLFIFLLPLNRLNAQHTISFDAAAIRNLKKEMNGLNLSCFYHFSEHITGGLEVNNFFRTNKTIADEEVQLSALDLDFNFHYVIPLHKDMKCYPICGVSHTSEKEKAVASDENRYEHFWSVNAGAGLLLECGHWLPHVEYTYTWGKLNQQFLLAGISYELELGHHKKSHHEN
ncbi:MAG: hypothetical protein QM725_08155 [Lacibacter sp.]